MSSFPLANELQKEQEKLPFPPEIIAEIFFHCLPFEFTIPDPTTAPLVLCGICHQYREIALSTPALWSSLSLDVSRMARSKAYLELLHKWIARAGNTPLSLSFQENYTSQTFQRGVIPDNSSAIESLISTAVALSGQWRNIEIKVFVRDDINALLLPIKGTLPLLEKLIVVYNKTPDPPTSIASAPNLRCVSARYHPQMRLPWHQLTTFHCDSGLDAASALNVLRDSPNMLDAAFTLNDMGTPTSALSLATLRHARLECLTLGGFAGFQEDLAIFRYLETPSVKTLRVLFQDTVFTIFRPLDISPFLSFLSQPSLRLHTLILSHLPATPVDLIACSRATLFLVHLKVRLALHTVLPSTDETRAQMDTMFGQLTRQSDFLPHLESLHLVFPGNSCDNAITPSVVIEMLCWRWAGTGTAQLLSFRLAHETDYKIESDAVINSHPESRRLEDEGMDLYVGVANTTTDSDSFWEY
ncbi:hypothetical protein B0H16DRAFT_1453741 [Mycena metata]|uniref:F-box domain-containing protein n=1 Tax=Mycena metata TaxID=1033252 RepID=A0AAD7NMQ0_9AGAR|nr:hypothetical protein B0H16DRAFT_1453741 [Mycena metata]